MKRRLKDRVTAVLATLLMSALVVGTWYMAESAADRSTPRTRALGHVPDYFVEGLAMIRLNGEGRPIFRMLADEMRHFPDDGTTEFDAPVMVSLDPERPTVRLTAKRARTDAEGRVTELIDDVLLVREASPGVPRMTVETDFAIVDSVTEVARTRHPVLIRRGESTLTGVGMEFDNAARQLRVDSEVRGQWRPQPATEAPPRP